MTERFYHIPCRHASIFVSEESQIKRYGAEGKGIVYRWTHCGGVEECICGLYDRYKTPEELFRALIEFQNNYWDLKAELEMVTEPAIGVRCKLLSKTNCPLGRKYFLMSPKNTSDEV